MHRPHDPPHRKSQPERGICGSSVVTDDQPANTHTAVLCACIAYNHTWVADGKQFFFAICFVTAPWSPMPGLPMISLQKFSHCCSLCLRCSRPHLGCRWFPCNFSCGGTMVTDHQACKRSHRRSLRLHARRRWQARDHCISL